VLPAWAGATAILLADLARVATRGSRGLQVGIAAPRLRVTDGTLRAGATFAGAAVNRLAASVDYRPALAVAHPCGGFTCARLAFDEVLAAVADRPTFSVAGLRNRLGLALLFLLLLLFVTAVFGVLVIFLAPLLASLAAAHAMCVVRCQGAEQPPT
jgi:hypothetical protein